MIQDNAFRSHRLKNDYGFRRSAPELTEMEGIRVAGRLVSPRRD
jgi:hypothetical protein